MGKGQLAPVTQSLLTLSGCPGSLSSRCFDGKMTGGLVLVALHCQVNLSSKQTAA
jgi:hypothetical protein